MTIKKSIIGIVLFVLQISIAMFYNRSIDLTIILGLSVIVFSYIIYKFVTRKYDGA